MSLPLSRGPLTGAIAHIDIVVGDLERSLDFYCGLLEPLGWRRHGVIVGERGERVVYLAARDGAQVGLRARPAAAGRPGGPDRYDVGLHHLAFRATSRDAVTERARWLAALGAEIESGPREYGYTPGYFAVFFFDPDGLKLEIVHIPQPGSAS